ncbi:hypothetical protein B0T09DRAFT_66068 [Sordaria sp. MPI-SDFR-AT-0083]|nr:hypothetical protein B0T09DRAFT_66068 [Sordaria sp. MPI-SDFR-AT-0083]
MRTSRIANIILWSLFSRVLRLSVCSDELACFQQTLFGAISTACFNGNLKLSTSLRHEWWIARRDRGTLGFMACGEDTSMSLAPVSALLSTAVHCIKKA